MTNTRKVYLAYERAKSSFFESEEILKHGFELAAVNRAYYTTYYTITALLLTRGVKAKTHKGLITLFQETFVQPGIFSLETSAGLGRLFSMRQEADYEIEVNLPSKEVAVALEIAKRFILEAGPLIENFLNDDGEGFG